MLSLEQALRDLRRDILVGLAGEGASSVGAASVERMTLSLGVRPRSDRPAGEGTGGWEVHVGPGPAPHQVTVEISWPGRGLEGGGVAPMQAATSQATAPDVGDRGCLAGLAEVFGAPGFDSAARATVFRETLEPLSEVDRRVVLASLGEVPGAEVDPSLGLARHLLRRLAGSGPGGSQEGPERLRRLAERFPVEELIRVAAERWRTQSEWAAEAADPVESP